MTGAALTRTGVNVTGGCGIIAKREFSLCALLYALGIPSMTLVFLFMSPLVVPT
jgi:hypothetical protein